MNEPTPEDIEQALMLADEENENSISSGKNFNSQGWTKVVLARAYRALQAQVKAKDEKIERQHNALVCALHAIRHVTCVASSEYAGGPKMRAGLGEQIYELLLNADKTCSPVLSASKPAAAKQEGR